MIQPCTHLFFEALASPLRLQIVDLLLQGPKTVSEITDVVNAEQSRVSHALTALADCKLVTARRDGKQRIYSVETPLVGQIIKLVREHEKDLCPECTRLRRK